jgi:hypothetical protein
MTDYDPDKIRFFSTEENFNPGIVMTEINRKYDDIHNLTDLLANSNGVRISKQRKVLNQDLIKAAKQVLIAFRGERIGRLSTEQQREILVMMDELMDGKRIGVQFQLNRACDGIIEVFSSKNFLFQHKQQDKK